LANSSNDGKEMNISYETLFEVLRREKNRDALQKLDISFFADLTDYIRTKKQILNNKMQDIGSFSEEEIKKIEVQIFNVNKIVKELYDKREKKTINMAIARCRTGTDMVEISNLLPAEKNFYDDLINTLIGHRCKILSGIIEFKNTYEQSKMLPGCRIGNAESSIKTNEDSSLVYPDPARSPEFSLDEQEMKESKSSLNTFNSEGSEQFESFSDDPEGDENSSRKGFFEYNDNSSAYQGHNNASNENDTMPDSSYDSNNPIKLGITKDNSNEENGTVVRFVYAVPKFLGRDLSEFGPFETDEIATLPKEIASILINKGRVEEIKVC
jgi:DNA replication initiation complex subunit (GINS family)